MEKKRRARINHCLDELKKILLENVNKDVSMKLLPIHIHEIHKRACMHA